MAGSGILLVVSSPSGAGKTTLCRRLQADCPELTFSVSTTTRAPRPGERDGEDYRFVDGARFEEMVREGAFAEWAEVHGQRYGTSLDVVREAVEAGRAVLFDIDWQGGRQLRARFPDHTLMVFVLPPTMAELARRLRARASDDDAAIARRLAKAREELRHYGEYDYLIVNDDLDRAFDELRSIYLAARAARARRAHAAEALLREE